MLNLAIDLGQKPKKGTYETPQRTFHGLDHLFIGSISREPSEALGTQALGNSRIQWP